MIRHVSSRRTASILIVALVWLLGGCQHTIEIKEKSEGSESFTPITETPAGGVPLGYVKTVNVLSNGVEYPPSDNLLYRVRIKLLETKLFYDIVFQRPAINHVELNLIVTEEREKNAGKNFAKGMAAAVTLGLLAPVFPQYQEYTSEYNLHVTNLAGEQNTYKANSSGSLEGSSGEGSMGRQHLGELYQTVNNNNLNSLMSQLLKDAEFILMKRSTNELKFES